MLLQTECHGRDFLWAKCKDVLEKQQSILKSVPSRRLNFVPSLTVLYLEQEMQV